MVHSTIFYFIAEYHDNVKCINKVGKQLGDCMRQMSSVMEASAVQAPLANRVPYTCWFVFPFDVIFAIRNVNIRVVARELDRLEMEKQNR